MGLSMLWGEFDRPLKSSNSARPENRLARFPSAIEWSLFFEACTLSELLSSKVQAPYPTSVSHVIP